MCVSFFIYICSSLKNKLCIEYLIKYRIYNLGFLPFFKFKIFRKLQEISRKNLRLFSRFFLLLIFVSSFYFFPQRPNFYVILQTLVSLILLQFGFFLVNYVAPMESLPLFSNLLSLFLKHSSLLELNIRFKNIFKHLSSVRPSVSHSVNLVLFETFIVHIILILILYVFDSISIILENVNMPS